MSKIQKSFPSTPKKAVVTDPITKPVFFVFFCEHNFFHIFYKLLKSFLFILCLDKEWIIWIITKNNRKIPIKTKSIYIIKYLLYIIILQLKYIGKYISGVFFIISYSLFIHYTYKNIQNFNLNIKKPKKMTDIWRDSPLRYLGYANEVGEAFKPIFPEFLNPWSSPHPWNTGKMSIKARNNSLISF